MRKIIGASLLVIALSCATYAGHIPNPAPGEGYIPNPASSEGHIPNGAPGEGHIPNDITDSDVQDSQAQRTLTEVGLSLLNSALSLL